MMFTILALAVAAPISIPVAGALTGPDGAALTGTQEVTFQLWNAASGGSAVGETLQVTFVDGAFFAILGESGGLDSSLFATPRWLSITTAGGTPSERVRITSAPMAGFAAQAGHADVADALSAPYPWEELDVSNAPLWAKQAPEAGSGVQITGTTYAVDSAFVNNLVRTGNQAHTGTRTFAGAATFSDVSTFNALATFNQGFVLGAAGTFNALATFTQGLSSAGPTTFAGTTTFNSAPSFTQGFSTSGPNTVGGTTTFNSAPSFTQGFSTSGPNTLGGTTTFSTAPTFSAGATVNGRLTAVGNGEWPFVLRYDSTTATDRVHVVSQRSRNGGAVATGDTLGGVGMGGKYDATNYAFGWNGGSEVSGVAAEAWTGTARGADLVLLTTPLGTATITERMRISADGTNRLIGALDLQGTLIRTIARAQAYTDDATDVGATNRQVSFTKRFADTAVRVTYSDNLRVAGTAKACRWEVRFDGNPCTNPGGLYTTQYEGNTGSNRHDPTAFVATCTVLAAGSHVGRIYVDNAAGYSGSDCHSGWNSNLWSLEVEEVR